MILKEGDKVRKTENDVVYRVKKIDQKGFVILSSEDGSSTTLMNVEDLGLYFTPVRDSLAEGPSTL
jgi:hypothetical protein